MIAPFQCVDCNAPLVVVDAPSLACRYCGAINAVPEAYREELHLARDLDEATRSAIREWARLDHLKVPRWWFVCAASAPFLLLVGGLGVLLAAGLLRLVSSTVLPLLVGLCVWLPLVPAQAVAAKVAMRNLLVSGAVRVGAAFAAISPSAPGEPPNCRQCGAPLSVLPDDILVRCLYCEAESIVQLDRSGIQALQLRLGSAQSSFAQAMAALAKHASLPATCDNRRTGRAERNAERSFKRARGRFGQIARGARSRHSRMVQPCLRGREFRRSGVCGADVCRDRDDRADDGKSQITIGESKTMWKRNSKGPTSLKLKLHSQAQ